jgi:predicted nucleic acid-binding protein
MSRLLIVDSSVAYKWYYKADEPGAFEADALLVAQLAGECVLAAPATLPVEVSNAMRYTRLPQDTVLDIIELIALARVDLYGITGPRLRSAAILAYRHKLSIYDALFLALAEELDCPLVTADRKAFANLDTKVEIRLI